MSWRTCVYGALVAAAVWQGRAEWLLRPVHPGDGVIAPDDPVQNNLRAAMPLQHGRWLLTPRAHYDITARILSREDYHFDAVSDLIPEDLALGWGPMSDNRILGHLDISQAVRFYNWESRGPLPIPREDIVDHSANTHVIPANPVARRELGRLRVGQVVHLIGELVDGESNDGVHIRTSMTRTDEGPGACEIMLVEEVEVLDPADVTD